MSPLVEVKNLEVFYGKKRAVRGLSFNLNSGESVGLLGANGAGKSSTIKALLGMIPSTKGNVSLLGFQSGDYRAFERVGFAPEEGAAPEYLTGFEYLIFVGSLHQPKNPNIVQEARELLSWFELNPDQKIREYSKGMKRRILLAQAFVGSPDLLILDEPLNGLDPLMIVKLREKLHQKSAKGTTLLYSSHILTEVEKNCSRAIILREGEIVLDEPIEKIIQEYGSVENAFTQKVGHT